MLFVTVLIALTNLALGYALAVYLGWASWPISNKSVATPQPPASPHHH